MRAAESESVASRRSHRRAGGAGSVRGLLALAAVVGLGIGAWLLTRAPTTEAGRSNTEADRSPETLDTAFAEAERLFEADAGTQTRRSIEQYRHALELARDQGDRPHQLKALERLADAHAMLAECHLALPYLDAQLELLRAESRRQEEAEVLSTRGTCLLSLGDLEGALRASEEALAIHQQLSDRSGEGRTHAEIGAIYSRLGELSQATSHLRESLQLADSIDRASWRGDALYALGELHRQLGEPNLALAAYQRVTDESGGDATDRRLEILALRGMGSAYQDLGRPREAVDHLEQALALAIGAGNVEQIIDAQRDLGSAQIDSQAFDQARKNLERAVELAESIESPLQTAASLYAIARLQRTRGRLEEARSNLTLALDLIESSRAAIRRRDLRATFLASREEYYALLVDTLMALHRRDPADGYAAVALEINERSKARTLLDTLAEANVDIRRGVDVELLERLDGLKVDLNAHERFRQMLLARGADPQEIRAIDDMLREDLAIYYELMDQIRASSPDYAALMEPGTLSVEEVQALLGEDSILLEYRLGAERSFLWALSSNSLDAFELAPRHTLEELGKRAYRLLTARNERVRFETPTEAKARIQAADRELPTVLAALGDACLRPMWSRLGNRRLVIVPDGILEYLPFAVLPLPDSMDPENPPLIARHEIYSLPSASVLPLLRDQRRDRRPKRRVAVLADPVFEAADPRVSGAEGAGSLETRSTLRAPTMEVSNSDLVTRFPRVPFTRIEAQAIFALAPTAESSAFFDFEASRATVLTGRLRDYAIVHFATHGILHSRHPELSALVLSLVDSDGRQLDGFLRLHDIYNLELLADLVVLSGCRTGLGKEVSGEGLIGLTRGFLYAGADRVAVSLWDVHDRATADFMKVFYERLLAGGLPAGEAMRQAQLHGWRSAEWPQPYYWAPFVIQGDWR